MRLDTAIAFYFFLVGPAPACTSGGGAIHAHSLLLLGPFGEFLDQGAGDTPLRPPLSQVLQQRKSLRRVIGGRGRALQSSPQRPRTWGGRRRRGTGGRRGRWLRRINILQGAFDTTLERAAESGRATLN